MNELLNIVTAKTGLNPEQAQEVINLVLGFLKERLPASLGSGLDLLTGVQSAGAAAGGAGESLAGEAVELLETLFLKRAENQ